MDTKFYNQCIENKKGYLKKNKEKKIKLFSYVL